MTLGFTESDNTICHTTGGFQFERKVFMMFDLQQSQLNSFAAGDNYNRPHSLAAVGNYRRRIYTYMCERDLVSRHWQPEIRQRKS